jgi:biopolymer transport protein TolR
MGMSSGSNSGGKRHRIMGEINVTPLVDVMLVLLIIFMVTAPMMQQGLEVDLPETASSGVQTSDDPFVIVISQSGKISAGSAQLDMDSLQKKLRAIFATRKDKQIYIQADKKTYYGTVAEVLAEARAAGIYNISLVTLPKANP